MMSKRKKCLFVCTTCGGTHQKWMGQCQHCEAWNTLQEAVSESTSTTRGYAGTRSEVFPLSALSTQPISYVPTCFSEFNRVLGGGLVPGAVILMGGDPGVGKSTLVLQVLAALSVTHSVLYVTGEESPQQVGLRAKRLGLSAGSLQLLAETDVHAILEAAQACGAQFMVIDSIQTLYTANMPSAPGSVAQVRDCAAMLAQFAKQTQTTIFLIGHVTKTGEVAGPRVLEHIVDTVIYMEGRDDGRYRVVRATKNRFGAIHEFAVFAMREQGMQQVANPSALFLSRPGGDVPGSTVTAIWEGTRPLLLEIQALVDESFSSHPKRVCVGVEANRLGLLLAVLNKHVGVSMHDKDVFINVVGGCRIQETSADLAVLAAVISSWRNEPWSRKALFLGEVGLSGEIRPISQAHERIKESIKQGFTQLVLPQVNARQLREQLPDTIQCQALSHVHELPALLKEGSLA